MPAPVIYFDLGNTLKFNIPGGEQAYPDAATTLQTLWSRGYRIGLLSNQAPGATVAQVRARLVALGLSDFIDTITISTEIPGNVGKPSQPIFDLALTKAGYTTGSADTVFITETPGHIQAARNMGWRAILKRNSGMCVGADGECVEGLAPLTLLFPALPVDLWVRDATSHTGSDLYTGSGWWSSPDMWIRNFEDDGLAHQSPEAGQDNWFYCRVRNRGSSIVRNFTVSFTVKEFLGTQFIYPADWFPSLSVASGGQIDPGDSRIVKARWNSADVPAVGTHACWLAAVLTNNDSIVNGSRVWEHNNLGQKNLAIVDAIAGDTIDVPVTFGNRHVGKTQRAHIEIIRPRRFRDLRLVLKHPKISGLMIAGREIKKPVIKGLFKPSAIRFHESARIELGSLKGLHIKAAAGSNIGLLEHRQKELIIQSQPVNAELQSRTELNFPSGRVAATRLQLPPHSEESFKVSIEVPKALKPEERMPIEIVERNEKGQIIGGVAIEIRATGTAKLT